ncbi:MAG: hypothetical protein WCT03_26585 [Candidatus Obscuribacterales bacterium]|jgi:hypothetical protein
MAVENGDKTGDKNAPQPVGEGKDASEKFRADLNVMSSLQLKDPGKQSTADMMGYGYLEIRPIPSDSPMNDPHKFLDVASKLVKADPDGGLSMSDLKSITKSPTASADEKVVAKELQANYMKVASSDENSPTHLLRFIAGIGTTVQQEGLDRLKGNLDSAALFAKHPELTDPKTLAATLERVTSKLPNHEYGLADYDLGITDRKGFTEQERAAAELARLNFDVLAKLGDDGKSWVLNASDRQALLATGKPVEKAEVKPGCEEHTSPTGNAVKWGVGVGAISKVSGSDQSVANGLVAAASAIIAANIKNSICEK